MFSAVLAANTTEQWTDDVFDKMLYIIARDNESEQLVRVVAEYPPTLITLAEKAVISSEWEAKWQIAVALSEVYGPNLQIEALLLQFAQDEDEYVRRRALMALADFGSEQALMLVDAAWQSGDEYEQRAVLYALRKLHSPLLNGYLQQAEDDND